MSIHPSAVVHPDARIGANVEIGAFAYVGGNVTLAAGCRIHHHATVDGHTTLGERCEAFPQAVLGAPPQDVKFRGEKTTLEIGSDNIFREMVTAHPGTGNGGGITRIGDKNLFLIGVHVAHDCCIGSRCILANYVQLAGHVHLQDNVNMGGHSAVHHFVTVGRHAFIGGMTRVAADVPPFVVMVAARGTRSEIRMINGVGLQRSGFSSEDIGELKAAFMELVSRRARMSGVPMRDRVETLLADPSLTSHARELCEFLLRSFAHGRHGRYLESLRADAVHRPTWRPDAAYTLTVNVVGRGVVHRAAARRDGDPRPAVELTAQAEAGWAFVGWNGNLRGKKNPECVVLDDHKTIDATFSPLR